MVNIPESRLVGLWCLRHFQQYLSYIVAVSLLVEETGVPVENDRTAACYGQTIPKCKQQL